MDKDGDKDATLTKKMEKLIVRKKKREAKAVSDLVEDDQFDKVEKKRKTDKRKPENYTEESGDKDAKRVVTEHTISVPYLVEEDNQHGKTENKKKEKKKAEVGYEISNAKILGKDSAEVVNNYQNENKEKKKKKVKRKPEVGSEINFAEIGEKIYAKADDNYLIEKNKKKKKRLEQVRSYQSNDEINNADKQKTCLEVDDGRISKTSSERKERKTKRSKEEERKNENGSVSIPTEILKDKVREGFETVKDQTEKKKTKNVRGNGDNRGKGESTSVENVETTKADTNVSEKAEKKHKREKNKGKDLKDGETKGDKVSNGRDINAVESNTKDSKPEKKKKKVCFSDHDEVFPLDGGIVQGKRFSQEEDEMVKQAVFDYIKAHDLGDEGLTMVLHCKSHPKVKNCWKEIGQALPFRPYKSVYDRAHSLFERDHSRAWSSEELETIRKYHAEHGSKWKPLADVMGKHRRHLKDAWRRTKLPDRKKGHWSQEEYQALFDLVNVDLRAKVNEEKKSKHGMLKDNISWMAISDTLATRNNYSCCKKWYNQLTSSMVKEGQWADTDDYHLVDALHTLDACCIEDVDWDSLLEHRSGDICLKRWKQMANHIGEHGKKSFVEQVEILSKRYCAESLEAREIWDNKPVVP